MKTTSVLIIDDEEAFLNSLKKRLEKRDVRVFTAQNGPEGLDILKQHRDIDVVILDVKMPYMDGLQVLEFIKKDFPACEVIFLTGHATVETAVEGMKRGAFDYLMKPCFIEDLMQKISEAVEKKRAVERAMEEERIKKNISSVPE